MAGQQLGSGIGQLFGVQDPQLRMISQRNALARQIDPNDPNSYMTVANLAAQGGDPQFAMSLAAAGQTALKDLASRRSSLATAQKTELATQQEMELRAELAKLGPTATSDEILGVVAKYGSPDKVLAVLQGSADKAENRAARVLEQEANRQQQIQLQKERLDAQLEAARQRGADQKEIAQILIEGRRTTAALIAGLKSGEKNVKAAQGRDALESELDNLTTAYTELNTLKAIPSTQRNAFSNISASMGATGIGQIASRMVGTEAQTQRDIINGASLRLLNSIKEATGMSSQQLNSNMELKTWLKAVSDPSQSIEAVTKNLDNIRTWVGKRSGGGAMPPAGEPAAASGQWGTAREVK
jgi:hypothetical protein